MTSGARSPLGFEAFGTACGLAVVAGAVALLAPGLTMLTGALVALAVAGWASLHRPASGRRPTSIAYLPPFAILAVAGGVFLDPTAPLGSGRALLLGLSVVPLWVVERGAPRRSSRGLLA